MVTEGKIEGGAIFLSYKEKEVEIIKMFYCIAISC